MIYKGKVIRIGGGANMTQLRYGMIDALEIEGYPEVREVKGTTYLLDHVRSAMDLGEIIVVGMHGTTAVAVKRNGKTYSDVNFQGVVNAQGFGYLFLGLPLLLFPPLYIGFLIYHHLKVKKKMNAVVKEVENA